MVSASGIDGQHPEPVAWKLHFVTLRGNFAVTALGLDTYGRLHSRWSLMYNEKVHISIVGECRYVIPVV